MRLSAFTTAVSIVALLIVIAAHRIAFILLLRFVLLLKIAMALTWLCGRQFILDDLEYDRVCELTVTQTEEQLDQIVLQLLKTTRLQINAIYR